MRRIARWLLRTLGFWLPPSLRYRSTAKAIRESGLFDAALYLDNYRDVREAEHCCVSVR
jgi:hypothetical protein